jgi:hypothetical protein
MLSTHSALLLLETPRGLNPQRVPEARFSTGSIIVRGCRLNDSKKRTAILVALLNTEGLLL